MKLSFEDLNKTFFSISNIFITKQINKEKITIDMCKKPRSTDALMLFLSGTAICYQNDSEPQFVPQCSIVYMPKNSLYTWEITPNSETGTQERILFEFDLINSEIIRSTDAKKSISIKLTEEKIDFSNKIELLNISYLPHCQELFDNLLKAFVSTPLNPLEVYSYAYELFGILSKGIKQRTKNNYNFKIIKPGIDYIKDNPNSTISIKKLSAMCNVSIGYFERIFRSCYGMSPLEYINSQRIYKIKTLLQEKSLTLSQIAEELDLCDSGHLCRFFKKGTGMTPGEYKKLYSKFLI